jgi:hypothetical protein
MSVSLWCHGNHGGFTGQINSNTAAKPKEQMQEQAKASDLTFTLDGLSTADDNQALISYNSETCVSETMLW